MAKLENDDFLDIVRKTRSLSPTELAKRLGCSRQAIYDFRNRNPKVWEKAKKIIDDAEILVFSKNNVAREVFFEIPCIVQWLDIQSKRMTSDGVKNQRVNTLFNVCNHLGVHPEKLTIDLCADLVNEMRERAYNDELDPVYGLSYYSIRRAIRSFFMLYKGVSGEILTAKGISAEASRNAGSFASEKVPKEVRHKIYNDNDGIGFIVKQVTEYNINNDLGWDQETITNFSWELMGSSIFMYYTGTRKTATLEATFDNRKNKYNKEIISINVTDKGRKGGLEWDKILMNDGLKKFRKYISERFGIPEDQQDNILPKFDSLIFPLSKEYDYDNIQTDLMRTILEGANYEPIQPNHIWRHSMAQDGLKASDYNYELVAKIGGWKDTATLRNHYGEMDEDATKRGLLKMMGEKVPEVTYELRW